MDSKKFLYKFCIFYMISLLIYQSIFAQTEECTFSDSDIESVEVGQVGDRQIYTLFTSHLYNEPRAVSAIMGSYSPMNAVGPLNRFIERNQERIASEQSDVQKITQLAESGKIDWIGVERPKTNASYIDNAVDNYRRDQDFINLFFQSIPGQNIIDWLLQSTPEWNANKTDQLLFLFYPAHTIAYANHPEAFRKIKIYPLEDELLVEEFSDRANDYIHYDKLVREDPHITSHQYSSISSFFDDTILPKPRLITESEFEDLLTRLEVPEEFLTRIRMRRFRIAHNDVISIALKRDVAAIQSILGIPGNGLVIFGTTHGPGIKQGLITACQNETN